VQEIANHRSGRGKFIGPRQDRVTVRQLLDALLRDYDTRRLASAKQARNHVAHLNAILGNALAISVGRDTINRYITERRSQVKRLGGGYTDTTIDRELEILGRSYQLAIDEGRLAFKPKIPRLVKMHSNARQGFFELADFRAVVAEIADPDVADFLWWFYFTGMRPKEIRSLTWDAFDRETWTLRLAARDAKTGFGRALPLEGDWREIIERRLARREFGYAKIFHLCGRSMPDLSRRWMAACKRAGIAGMRMYDLRRTAVRNLVRAGVPERVTMLISGHRTRSCMDRYNIGSDSDLRSAAKALSAYVSGLKVERPPSVVPIREGGGLP
jgi:integrase